MRTNSILEPMVMIFFIPDPDMRQEIRRIEEELSNKIANHRYYNKK